MTHLGAPVRMRFHRQGRKRTSNVEQRAANLDIPRLAAVYYHALKESLAQVPQYFDDEEFEERS